MRKIDTVEALEALYPEPMPLALAKVATRLTPLYRRWIEGSRSPRSVSNAPGR